jgi:hypothetical protein
MENDDEMDKKNHQKAGRVSLFTHAFFLSLIFLLIGCTTGVPNDPASPCPVTESLWIKPPQDAAVQNEPDFGYYFVNDDSSILASAQWTMDEEYRRVREDGVKVGWFRPEGAELMIAGRRLDGGTPVLDAHIPCCYPTRFQSSGLFFPTEGCWEVTAKAGDSELSFIVWIEP